MSDGGAPQLPSVEMFGEPEVWLLGLARLGDPEVPGSKTLDTGLLEFKLPEPELL